MFREIIHSADHLISSEGAWWILGMNGLLLIPALFAFFFYPVPILMGIGALAALAVAGLVLRRVMARGPLRPKSQIRNPESHATQRT